MIKIHGYLKDGLFINLGPFTPSLDARYTAHVVIGQGALTEEEEDRLLAQYFLDRSDEDWTYIDPEDVKRLARAVLDK